MIITNKFAKWVLKIPNLFEKNIVGITIWTLIFIWPPKEATKVNLIKHEKKHVEQWKRYYIIGFIVLYFYQYVKYGYRNMPLEIEAREAEK